jgi:tetratricopeptide (TPR) repeat protein
LDEKPAQILRSALRPGVKEDRVAKLKEEMSRLKRNRAASILAAGFGAVVAGPLGVVTGAFLGGLLGDVIGKSLAGYAEKLGEETAKKFLKSGANSTVESAWKSVVGLENLHCQALRLSLASIRGEVDPEYDDWFANWERSLESSVMLGVEGIRTNQLNTEDLDSVFCHALERLDAEGAAIERQSQSLTLRSRTIPLPLLKELNTRLPMRFIENFRTLIVLPENAGVWQETEHFLRKLSNDANSAVDTATRITSEKRRMLEVLYDSAKDEGRIPEESPKAREEEIDRLSRELGKLQRQLARRSNEPTEVEFSRFLDAGDLDGALRLKSQQVELRTSEGAKLSRNYSELGTIHELRSEWIEALAAYRKAWEYGNGTEEGFKYAWTCQKLNRTDESIATYEALLRAPSAKSDRAKSLNNLGLLYGATRRSQDAERAYNEALATYRELAQAKPEEFLPGLATTLNNLALLYRDTQRLQKAEEAYGEALSTRRQLVEASPDVYLPDVAMTLNNLANLYSDTQRMTEAEIAYNEALAIRRRLANDNPGMHFLDVAATLNNLATLYSDTGRKLDAERAYNEALTIRRLQANDNPESVMLDVAATLNNLATLYRELAQQNRTGV